VQIFFVFKLLGSTYEQRILMDINYFNGYFLEQCLCSVIIAYDVEQYSTPPRDIINLRAELIDACCLMEGGTNFLDSTKLFLQHQYPWESLRNFRNKTIGPKIIKK
ncbi:hypothetical protein ACJX0J_007237, partial [Zea mays]